MPAAVYRPSGRASAAGQRRLLQSRAPGGRPSRSMARCPCRAAEACGPAPSSTGALSALVLCPSAAKPSSCVAVRANAHLPLFVLQVVVVDDVPHLPAARATPSSDNKSCKWHGRTDARVRNASTTNEGNESEVF
eukprot:6193001-Pleurochrysis_carterae.AAC.6